jgi:hypothetical protein
VRLGLHQYNVRGQLLSADHVAEGIWLRASSGRVMNELLLTDLIRSFLITSGIVVYEGDNSAVGSVESQFAGFFSLDSDRL